MSLVNRLCFRVQVWRNVFGIWKPVTATVGIAHCPGNCKRLYSCLYTSNDEALGSKWPCLMSLRTCGIIIQGKAFKPTPDMNTLLAVLALLLLGLDCLLFHCIIILLTPILLLSIILVYMAQIPFRLNDISYPPLELLCLGEAPIFSSVPESFCGGSFCPRSLVGDGNDKGSACGGLESNFAEACRERGQ